MIFKLVKSKQDIEPYLNFNKLVYKNNKFYRDSMSEILKLFLFKKTVFLKHGEFIPFIIEDQGIPVLRAAFIIDDKQQDSLIISFFEALENQFSAVDLMLAKARELAKNKGLKKIIIGLDAHLNYGVGFLATHYDNPPCFGLNYTPQYYLDYFQGMESVEFTSVLIDVENFDIAREARVLQRIKKQGFTFRRADFSRLQKEIEVFTSLNNLGFQDQLWWTERTFAEDKELLYPFRWFIKSENLIIAEKDGEPIGLLLWYPDFNQLVPPGKSLGLDTLIKLKLGGLRRINRFKIADIVIHPRYQGTGIVLGLLEMLQSLVKGRYKYGEGGWIATDNLGLKGFEAWRKLGCSEYKQYKAYELQV